MTAPLFGAPDPAPPANPWTLARALWPGAFAEPWQDEQIEAGRGDWPTVCVLWRGAMANPPLGVPASHSPITSWLRVLELRHVATGALHWRYRDEPAVDLRRPGRWPVVRRLFGGAL